MIISRRISSITKIILHHHKRCEKDAFFIGHCPHQLQQLGKKTVQCWCPLSLFVIYFVAIVTTVQKSRLYLLSTEHCGKNKVNPTINHCHHYHKCGENPPQMLAKIMVFTRWSNTATRRLWSPAGELGCSHLTYSFLFYASIPSIHLSIHAPTSVPELFIMYLFHLSIYLSI